MIVVDSIIVIFGHPRAMRKVRLNVADEVFSLSVESNCTWVLASTYESWDRTKAKLLCEDGNKELAAVQSVLHLRPAASESPAPAQQVPKRCTLFEVLGRWVVQLQHPKTPARATQLNS